MTGYYNIYRYYNKLGKKPIVCRKPDGYYVYGGG